MAFPLKENFPEFVRKQVEQRELFYGKKERDPQTLVYLNSNTSWIKLVSSVNIDPNSQKYKDLEIPEGFGGAELAKRAVLFNGTSFQDTQFSGISRENSILNNSVYGFGGNQFGLSPMPGITSITTKYKNRGSLREGTVNIVAHNPKQFEIIELLYLRLGYLVLLEYGHSLYLDDDGNVESNRFSLANDFLDNNFTDKYKVLEKINQTKDDSRGNYDALLARVTNFSWEFRSDGGYNITLDLRSLGDIIDSLSINSSLPLSNPTSETDTEEIDENEIKERLSKFKNLFDFIPKISELKQMTSSQAISGKELNTHLGKDQFVTNYFIKTFWAYNGNGGGSALSLPKVQRAYIRFGELLKILKENYFITGKNKDLCVEIDTDILTNLVPLNKYPISVEDPTKETGSELDFLKYSIKKGSIQSFSYDLDKCLVDSVLELDGTTTDLFKYPGSHPCSSLQDLNGFYTTINNRLVGKIMNIYLDIEFVFQLIQENLDDKGKISVLTFLTKLCNSINESFGNEFQLSPFIDDTTNKITIISETSIKDHVKIFNKITNNTGSANQTPTVFNLFGYDSNRAGFVTDFSFKTQLDNSFATQITIGAQANGSVVGENATAFSNWNQGLTDRIDPEKLNPRSKTLDESITTTQTRLKEVTENLLNILNFLENPPGKDSTSTNTEVLKKQSGKTKDIVEGEKLGGLYKDFINFTNEYILSTGFIISKNNNSIKENIKPSLSFLPLNLSLTMKGLSGFKIFQKFDVKQRVLPKNYSENLLYIVKGITHTVNEGGWSTTLETIMEIPDEKVLDFNNIIYESKPQIDKKQFVEDTRNAIAALPTNTPNANKLRETLQKLGFTEKGQEISSGGDITVNMEIVASAVLTTIKQKLPDISINITGGNDLFHQQLQDSKSRHKSGRGIDFTINPSTPDNIEKIEDILQGYAAGNRSGIQIRYLNEYATKTKNATGNHFHLSVGAGTEGSKEFTLAKKRADNKEIEEFFV